MLAFVDESGDTGFKLDRGSSPAFVVAMAVFADRDEAQRCDDRIANLLQLADYVVALAARREARDRDGSQLYERYLVSKEASWRSWP